MIALRIDALEKRFGARSALAGASLELRRGEFFCILGPTNAGKSTLLKAIAGLVAPDRGTIEIMGRDVTGLSPRERRVSLLFQNNALFPTLNGYDNIAFPLRSARLPPAEIERRVAEIARLLKLEHCFDRLPSTFSGGEQQRVAIGRALALPGDLLLLDEPLTNLDARIRTGLRIAFKKLHAETGQTILYVTHDQVEALSLADRIGVLHQGRFQQVGTPDALYERPANRVVAHLVGTPPMNLLPARIEARDGGLVLVGDGFAVPAEALSAATDGTPRDLAIGIRPEEIRVATARSEATPFAVQIGWVERLGARTVIEARLGAGSVKAVVPPEHPAAGEGPAWIGFAPRPHRLLDVRSGEFLT